MSRSAKTIGDLAPLGAAGDGRTPTRASLTRASLTRGLERGRRAASTYLGVGGTLLILIVYLTITEEHFATSGNVINVLETNAILLVVAVGLTYVMLVGGFDLSVGSMLGLSSVVLADLLSSSVPVGAAIPTVILGAAAVGLSLNGLLVAKVGLSFLVVTLGSASVLRGIALVDTDGVTETLDNRFLSTLGRGRIVGLPWIVVIALVVLVISIGILRYTGYGRMIYAVGGNREAARLAGINTTAVRASAFAIAAGLAGAAGVLEAGRLSAASPTAGIGLELTAAAAVLLGGTTFIGGRGTMFGTLLGVLLLGVLANGVTLAGISTYWQGIVVGSVVILALLLDRLRSVRQATEEAR